MTAKRLISTTEFYCIDAIVKRAQFWFPDRDYRDIKMDIVVTQLICPLRLTELLEADDTNFVHDVAGIERHLNRRTFKMEDCFVPRFADVEPVPQPEAEPL